MLENQGASPVNHRPNGKFASGNVANPKGRKRGSQSFVDRAAYLAGKYNLEQTIEICRDKKKLGKLSVFDAMIMQRFYEASTTGGYKSMDSILDRLLGKPDQYVRNENTNTVNVTLQRAVEQLRDLDKDTILEMKRLLENKRAPLIDNDALLAVIDNQ